MITAFTVIVTVFVYCACTREESLETKHPDTTEKMVTGRNSELTTDIAALYFQTVVPQGIFELNDDPSTRSTGEGNLLFRPILEKGKERRKGNIEVVEYPLASPRRVMVLDEATREAFRSGEKFADLRSVLRLVVRKNTETGHYDHFYMEIVGSLDYYRSGHSIGKNNYFHRTADFNGYVKYFDLEMGFVYGYKYTNGKITHRLLPSDEESYQASQTLTRGTICWDEPYFYEVEICESWEEEGDPEADIAGTITMDCWYEERVSYATHCETFPDDNNGGYDPDPVDRDDNNHGNNNNNNNNGQTNLAPNASKLLKLSGLTQAQLKMLEAMTNRIKADCMGRNLYNGLMNRLGSSRLPLSIISDRVTGSGSYSYVDGSITLSDGDIPDVLFHELFHGYQMHGQNPATSYGRLMNYEIEARIAQYRFMDKAGMSDLMENRFPGAMGEWARSVNDELDNHGNLRNMDEINFGQLIIKG